MNPAAFPGMVPFRGGLPAVRTWQKFGTLELNYDLSPNLSLTSLTGYYQHEDLGGLQLQLLGTSRFGLHDDEAVEARAISRRNSASRPTSTARSISPWAGSTRTARSPTSVILPGNVALFGSPAFARLFDGTHDIDIRAISLFGQGRFQVTPQFEIAAGARWTDEKRTSSPTSVDIFGAVTGVPGRVITDFAAEHAPAQCQELVSRTYANLDADRRPDGLRFAQAGLQVGILQHCRCCRERQAR